MDYQQTLNYLYNQLPMFTRVGAAAFKTDLTNTIVLCERVGNPQLKFKSVHVGGTNGKGSTSHMLASILQKAGYKVVTANCGAMVKIQSSAIACLLL